MIKSLDCGRAPLVERSTSCENTLHEVAQHCLEPEKIDQSSWSGAPRQVQRESLTGSHKKDSRCSSVQHFVPVNNKEVVIKHLKSPPSAKTLQNKPPATPTIVRGGMKLPGRKTSPAQNYMKKAQSDRFLTRKTPCPRVGSNQVVPNHPMFPSAAMRWSSSRCITNSTMDSLPELGTSRGAKWMSNAVFQKRLGRFAILIQSNVRRWLARKNLENQRQERAARTIQRVARGWRQRQTWKLFSTAFHAAQLIQKTVRGSTVRHRLRAERASVHIQRVSRGFIGRLRGKVARLEKMVQTIQLEKEEEVQKIEAEKDLAIANGFKEQENRLKLQQRKEKLAHETINELRRNNRHLREQNDKLMERCEDLATQNKRTEAITKKCFGHVNQLKATIKKLEADQKKLRAACAAFEAKMEKAVTTLEAINERYEYESRVRAAYMNTIKKLIVHINKNSSDKQLSSSIHKDALARLERAQEKICAGQA